MPKKILITIFLISFIINFYSCTSCHYSKGILNDTNDTLYMGISYHDNFDSIRYCLESREINKQFNSFTIYNYSDSIEYSLLNDSDKMGTTPIYLNWNERNFRGIPIFPGSGGYNSDNILFDFHNLDKSYIFVIQKKTADHYTLREIRNLKLYDKFPIARTHSICTLFKQVYIKYKGRNKEPEIILRDISDDSILP